MVPIFKSLSLCIKYLYCPCPILCTTWKLHAYVFNCIIERSIQFVETMISKTERYLRINWLTCIELREQVVHITYSNLKVAWTVLMQSLLWLRKEIDHRRSSPNVTYGREVQETKCVHKNSERLRSRHVAHQIPLIDSGASWVPPGPFSLRRTWAICRGPLGLFAQTPWSTLPQRVVLCGPLRRPPTRYTGNAGH